jgi:hypothetical protein
MQSTTRWCLNEGAMLSRMYDQNAVFHIAVSNAILPQSNYDVAPARIALFYDSSSSDRVCRVLNKLT